MKTFTTEEAAQICEAEAAKLKDAMEGAKANGADIDSITLLNGQFAEAEVLALKFRQTYES